MHGRLLTVLVSTHSQTQAGLPEVRGVDKAHISK